jgi:hypothetical protein
MPDRGPELGDTHLSADDRPLGQRADLDQIADLVREP